MTTCAKIIGALLRADEDLLAAVPASRIKDKRLPGNVELPALLVRTVSSIDRLTLKRGAIVRVNDRVAVTVRAASGREQDAIIQLVRRACAGFTGDLAGGERVAVLTDSLGPDVPGPGDSFEQTQDFRVSADVAA